MTLKCLSIFALFLAISQSQSMEQKQNQQKLDQKKIVQPKLLFMQLDFESPHLMEFKKAITTAANQIINGILPPTKIDFFKPNPSNTLVLHVIPYCHQDGLELLYEHIEPQIERLNPTSAIKFSQNIHFFGTNNDRLIMLLDDSKEKLMGCYQILQMIYDQTNCTYKKQHGSRWCNTIKSEQFTYAPHIELGRLRADEIIIEMEDPKSVELILKYVKKTLLEKVNQLQRDQPKQSEGVDFFNPKLQLIISKTQKVVKEYAL